MSFSSEVISKNCFKDTYKVYFGHHGDEGAMCADIVLPTPLYTEKNGIFVNIEGRPQEAKKCHNPIGLAKEEWTILKELSNLLSIPVSRIGLKATTSEKIGIIGKNKAIAVQSLVNLREKHENITN